MKKICNYINGELVGPSNRNYLDNINPATGKAYSLVPDSSDTDGINAIEAANKAFPAWSALPMAERVKYLRKIAQLIKEKSAELALAESIDNGKTLKLAQSVDIPRASTNFEFFADAATQFKSDFHPMDDHAINYTLHQPLGPVTCISPWNLPLYLLTWKIAPALVMGNTVVAKPSELTPMTAFLLAEICIEAGLPPGVLNIVHGQGQNLGDVLTTHPMIKAVSFTGSTATGKIIAEKTAPLFKKVSLEMGGKNPTIVFADADYEKALSTTSMAAFANQGQICLCGSRIFIERPIYEKFRDDLVAKAKKIRVGYPLDSNSHMGAVVSKPHMEKILSYIDMAKSEGAKVLCGGERLSIDDEGSEGFYVAPTLLENLSYDCRTNQEEIFGPVATLTPFDSEDEVINWANSTQYGLAGSVWTSNLSRAHRVAQKVQSGILWINTWLLRDLRTPFGGVKSSGMGREGGDYAFKFFTEAKNVCIKIEDSI